VTLPRGLHASGLHQALYVAAVDLGPAAFRSARREALQEGFVVEALRIPSIHPQHSATSIACAGVTLGCATPF